MSYYQTFETFLNVAFIVFLTLVLMFGVVFLIFLAARFFEEYFPE